MNQSTQFRIGAVSYLNTVPLVWGMLHGPQARFIDASFSIPSLCADRLKEGSIDAGIVPVAEIPRNGWTIVSDVGITCLGPVRSILLCSRIPFRQVKTLAADVSSRTSVELARIILRERFGCEPTVYPAAPEWRAMLNHAEAALVIGDPALQIDPGSVDCDCLDLGLEWFELTRLPMVFAAWASAATITPGDAITLRQLTHDSYHFGRERLDEIVTAEHARRGVSRELAHEYLTRHIRFEIGELEHHGLQTFYELARLSRSVAA